MRDRCSGGTVGTIAALALVLLAASGAAQTFTDQTAIGVEFLHHADPGDLLAMGAGGAWGDYDGDGDLDLYVCDRGGPNALFENLGAGAAFADVAPSLEVEAAAAESTGALWGDYDNDGDQDLYVMNRGANIMYRNDGAGGGGGWIFTDVTDTLGVAGFGRAAAAVYGDYDNDGWLDLYVANHYYEFFKPIPGGATTSADALYHNEDDGQGGRIFVDVAPATFGTDVLYETIAHSVGFFDYDLDDDLDIYLVNEVFGNDPLLLRTLMWRNDGSDGAGGWIFTDVSQETGTRFKGNPMGLAIGDYNNDGWFDFIMSDSGPNRLYRNSGSGTFAEVAEQAGVAREFVPGPETNRQVGWGVVFTDFDLDGVEDIYVATGAIGEPGARPQPNPLFLNNFDPPSNTFTDVTDASGANTELSSRTVVKGDYDLDGDEDLYVVNYRDQAVLYRNDQSGGDHLVLDLIGTRSNRDAIGTRVKVSSGLGDQWRMVQSGSTTGGSNDLALFYGLTGEPMAESIDVDWPSGTRTVLTQRAVNQRLAIRELQVTLDDASFDLDEYGRLSRLVTAVGDHLDDLRLYVAIDGEAPMLLGPDDFDVVRAVEIVDNRATSRVVSADGRLRIDLTADLNHQGPSKQAIKLRLRITNLTAGRLPIRHYAYYDWNIGGAAGDQGRYLTTRLRQRDWDAIPGRNFDMSANVPFSHWELGVGPALLDKLEGASAAIDLADNEGPVNGEVSVAAQFDKTLGAGATWQVVHNLSY